MKQAENTFAYISCMMKYIFITVSVFSFCAINAQPKDTAHLYNPNANAEKDIAAAVRKAKAEHKFLLIQAGGNWCSWCKLFNKTVTEDTELDSTLNANFIVYHLNYSPENMNRDAFAKLGYPQRFGFPVIIVLDDKGSRIHTQNSEYLEEGKGYNKEKVLEFFQNWSPKALDPNTYKFVKQD